MECVGTSGEQGTTTAFSRSGRSYWELIGVDDMAAFERQQALRQERYPNLRFTLVEQVRAGGGFTSFAVEAADLDVAVERARAKGLPMAEPVRRGQPGRSWALAGLTEGPTWFPFLISYGVPGDVRLARLPDSGWVIDHLVVETADPAGSGARLAELLELEVWAEPGMYVVPLPGAHVHLVAGAAEGIRAVRLR